jgi:hypothetical protein
MRVLYLRLSALAAAGIVPVAALACTSQPSTDKAPTQAAPQQTAAPQVDRAAVAMMPGAAQAALASVEVPVLAPNDQDVLQRAQIIPGNRFYSLTSRTPELTVTVQGSPLDRDTPAVVKAPVAPRVVGERQVTTSVSEGIRYATWVERGVAYSIDIECSKPSDPRCAAEDYVLSLVGKITALTTGRR